MSHEAFVEAYTMLNEWKPASDVYAIKHFGLVTSGASAIGGLVINGFYRKAVKLRNQVLISTLIPVAVLPALVGTLLHHHWVQRPLVLQTFHCPVCIELRGGAVQLFSGFVYPMVLAPIAAFHFASRLYTYALPSMSEPKDLLKTFIKLSKPGIGKFSVIAGVQVVLGVALTHMEAHNIFTVLSKLSAMEAAVRDHQEETKSSRDNHPF